MKKYLLYSICGLLSIPAFADGNLTSFTNGQGAVNNNAYNQMMNPARSPVAGSGGAVADFGNCNAVIIRCATPKCGGTGCSDISVATPIVAGCVASTPECTKYGDTLTNAIAAQMVASSTNKANAAAAQNQASQSSEQLNMVSEQLAQMQQQMAQQQQESQMAQQQLAEQLASQQQVAAPVTSGSDTGLSSDLIARQQIVGQIMDSLDGVDASLASLKKTVQDVIDYAGCDYNATSCTGPRRVAAFRKKAQAFFEPYDSVLGSLEDSLYTAIASGIDVTDIYMMLTGMCSQWGRFLCDADFKGASPFTDGKIDPKCHLLGLYKSGQEQEIQQNFIAMTNDSSPQKVACMDENVLKTGLFNRSSKKREISSFDIDKLEIVINTDEPKKGKIEDKMKICKVDDGGSKLREVLISKTYDPLNGNNANPVYALCSTHAYNIGQENNDKVDDKEIMNDVIALKATVIVQNMKSNYDYLELMVKQTKIQMQKSIMTATTNAVGGSATDTLPGTTDCRIKGLSDTISCLRTNESIVLSNITSNNSVSMAVKNQIKGDRDVIVSILSTNGNAAGATSVKDDCLDAEISKISGARNCINSINSGIMYLDGILSNQSRSGTSSAGRSGP